MNENDFIDKLAKSLENINNEDIGDFSLEEIDEQKSEILNDIFSNKSKIACYMDKLKHYRYIENVKDLKYGHYIRCIKLDGKNILNLNRGGVIVDMKIVNENEVNILCRNNMRKVFTIKFEKNLIFQKLDDQELLLLTVLDYLNT